MTHTLQARLALSLDKANKKEAAKRTVKDFVQADNQRLQEAGRNCTKLSVSLFDTDLKRLEALRSYMAGRGVMLSTSQAVKLAIRTAPLSDALQEALDQVKSEDGRKW